ncbi:MaoC/PaaZ C-terminal domain-containing protein [Nocardia sp. NPDC052278]|uniref:MaoC/PaaZ C-terminal domain-containing protein n=1 Tax=unclassified Nocardia TaxID=2637762 RepID=UPI0036BB4B1C
MSIDPLQAIGSQVSSGRFNWAARDSMAYNLSVGAGHDPVSPLELQYVMGERMKVVPSFAVIAGSCGVQNPDRVPGLNFDMRRMLHGEHEVELLRPIDAAGSVRTEGRVVEVYDKGDAALAILESTSTDENGDVVFVNRYSLFLRGAGGFGGPASPDRPKPVRPDREPDAAIKVETLPQQALLYRLNGDLNPIHADPEAADRAGFPRPILHGLATFGITCRAVVNEFLNGDVAAVGKYRARFASVVYPGETLRVNVWESGAHLDIEVTVPARNATVLKFGAMELVG